MKNIIRIILSNKNSIFVMDQGKYHPFQQENNNQDINKFNKKEKYINSNNKNYSIETPGYWQYDQKSSVIDNETFLRLPQLNNNQKTKLELKQNLDPENYQLPVSNSGKKESLNNFYYPGFDPNLNRKRFMNPEISNTIRLGDFTRVDTRTTKKEKESTLIDRWDFIDNRYQRLDHVVLPLPRGGEDTRKDPIPLNINKIEEDKDFIFNY